ncbi:MAG: alpha/beta hydrolase [Chloroflexi bacterium AL-W]|nr:alpha/beta hydrolase [Chloroflexi bacterium AL-N1]NOK70098.1 alpha/beta hydrolase [Chloroflexi bacterium AL-N10]NOK77890.1 alpha/beta hydrolase [Chloroflexi bacterium AL-N5]NOK84899.1 alpha/beta hydrolase [Chloroflexi bacterium AL-W]NOK91878.1 alpha/beta hydrolase [Chloroflexi bacterium AL-N15]
MNTQYIQTSILKMAYEVHGPIDGTPIILLHGFPDDVRGWDQVVEGIVPHGYRTYVPYLRGYGPTTFLSEDTVRSGQNGAIAQDIIEFANALSVEQFILLGHDWGANAAQAIAALYPERVAHLISFAPYSLTWSDYQEGPPNYDQIRALWYQNVLQNEMGAGLLYGDRRGFARYLWQTWSPSWTFNDETFEATAVSFDNPDFVRVVLNAYRWQTAEIDPRYDEIEGRLAQRPHITVPATIMLGQADGVNIFEPYMLEQQSDFVGAYTTKVFDGVGHFIHRERPEAVVNVILTW